MHFICWCDNRPKAVSCQVESLLHYANAHGQTHGYTPTSRVLLLSGISFDPYIGEVCKDKRNAFF